MMTRVHVWAKLFFLLLLNWTGVGELQAVHTKKTFLEKTQFKVNGLDLYKVQRFLATLYSPIGIVTRAFYSYMLPSINEVMWGGCLRRLQLIQLHKNLLSFASHPPPPPLSLSLPPSISLSHTGCITRAVCLIITGYTTNWLVTVICMTFAVGLGGFTYSGFMVNHLDIAPPYAGVLLGITNMFATIPGIVSPLLTGVIAQHHVSFTSNEPVELPNSLCSTSLCGCFYCCR